MEAKTLNQWMREMDCYWVSGKEELMKGTMDEETAKTTVAILIRKGAVTRGFRT